MTKGSVLFILGGGRSPSVQLHHLTSGRTLGGGGSIYAKLGWHKDIGGTTAIVDATGTKTFGGPGSPGLAVQSDSG